MRNYDSIVSIYNVMSILDAHNIAYVKDTVDRRSRLIICGNKKDEEGHYAIIVSFNDDGYVRHNHAPLPWEKYGGNDDIANGKKMIVSCDDFNHFGNYGGNNIKSLLRDLDTAVDYK